VQSVWLQFEGRDERVLLVVLTLVLEHFNSLIHQDFPVVLVDRVLSEQTHGIATIAMCGSQGPQSRERLSPSVWDCSVRIERGHGAALASAMQFKYDA
jgi:hypothetical protein